MTEERKDATTAISGNAAAASVGRADLSTKSHLTSALLLGARAHAESLWKLGQLDPVPDALQFMAFGASAVVAAAASLEAAGNEIINEMLDEPHAQAYSEEQRYQLRRLRDGQGNAVKKLGGLAKLKGAQGVSLGGRRYQHAAHLVELRNAVMHFKPAWSTDVVHTDDTPKFLDAIGRARHYLGEPNYPVGYLDYPVARWAVQVVCDVIDDFCPKIGVRDWLGRPGTDYSLPRP